MMVVNCVIDHRPMMCHLSSYRPTFAVDKRPDQSFSDPKSFPGKPRRPPEVGFSRKVLQIFLQGFARGHDLMQGSLTIYANPFAADLVRTLPPL